MFALLAAAKSGEISLCNSEVLQYEIARIPDDVRRFEALSLLSLASEQLVVTDAAEELAISFERHGLRALDALHLAVASLAKVDYFCTSDDKLFRKAQDIPGLGCKVITLLNLVVEILP